MAMKDKLKSLIIKHDIYDPKPATCHLDKSLAINRVRKESNSELLVLLDGENEEAAFNSIEDNYFTSDEANLAQNEIAKLVDDMSPVSIKSRIKELRKQLLVVSRKVFDMIEDNQEACAKELERVTRMKLDLQASIASCQTSRMLLSQTQTNFTIASLQILANYRRRQILRNLLQSLKTIKTLQRADEHLVTLLTKEDYAGAISLIQEYQSVGALLTHYQCIAELNNKLKDTLVMTKEQLDLALGKMCVAFSEVSYTHLQQAYSMIGQTQAAMDTLHVHFTTTIFNRATHIVYNYLKLGSDVQDEYGKADYNELCKRVPLQFFIPCLKDLCSAFWEILLNYYRIIQWHESHQIEELYETTRLSQHSTKTLGATLNRSYIREKLHHGQQRIWQDVQSKISKFILSSDLSSLTFDQFILVLDLSHRLLDIGDEFCKKPGDVLESALKTQCVRYFRHFHRQCMEEMFTFMEHEGWEVFPVRPSFNILQLHELKFLKSDSLRKTSSSVSSMSSPVKNFFITDVAQVNPFDIVFNVSQEEDITPGSNDPGSPANDFSDSEDEVPEELKRDYVDEKTGDLPAPRSRRCHRSAKRLSSNDSPLLTSTTVNILRLCGKYLHMMHLLRPVSSDGLICITHLFDYYLFVVYTFFVKDLLEYNEDLIENWVKVTINKIHDQIIMTSPTDSASSQIDKFPAPRVNFSFADKKSFLGLPKRMIAVESLMFLSKQYDLIYPYLDGLLPNEKKPFLKQFFNKTVKIAPNIRESVYIIVASQSLNVDYITSLMNQVNWEVKDQIVDHHNFYVDELIKALQNIEYLVDEMAEEMPVPEEVRQLLWKQSCSAGVRVFVDGFSQAKKVTNEGRSWMLLDFVQFVKKLESISEGLAIPDKLYAEDYIKAYYKSEDELREWIRIHKEYEPKHFLGLINSMNHLTRKSKNNLVALVEERKQF